LDLVRRSGISQSQPGTVFAQPKPVHSVIGNDGGDASPEFRGMVFFDNMLKFMNNDIINYGPGRHDQSPVEGKSVCRGTGTPETSCLSNPEAPGREIKLTTETFQTFSKVYFCLLHVPGDKDLAILAYAILSQHKALSVKEKHAFGIGFRGFDSEGIAAPHKEKGLSVLEDYGGVFFPDAFLPLPEALSQPFLFGPEKVIDFLLRCKKRSSYDNLAVFFQLKANRFPSFPAP